MENKRQKREEAQRRKEQFAEEQNAILERARQEMVAELTQAGQLLSPVGEDPISVQARQLTAKYLEELHQPMDGAVYEDTLFMYKVLLTPADELVEKLYSHLVKPRVGRRSGKRNSHRSTEGTQSDCTPTRTDTRRPSRRSRSLPSVPRASAEPPSNRRVAPPRKITKSNHTYFSFRYQN